MGTSSNILVIRDLKKRFDTDLLTKPKQVLDGVSLSVRRGEIYGFLGPNGSGKTTTIKSIIGLIFPDSGEIKIEGAAAGSLKARRHIGFMPERPTFYHHLNGHEVLQFFADISGVDAADSRKRIPELLERVGLADRADGALGSWSKGMVQRLALAQALINQPKLIILDEPMSGLDPIGRRDVREIIFGLKNDGVTVFFSSHIIPDVESLCDRVAVLTNGKVRAEGEIETIVPLDVQYFELSYTGVPPEELNIQLHSSNSGSDSHQIQVAAEDKNDALEAISEKGGSVIRLNPVRSSLEDQLIKTFVEDKG